MILYTFVALLLLGYTNAQDPAVNATEAPTVGPGAANATVAPAANATEAPTEAPTDPPTTQPPPDTLSVECTDQYMMVFLEHKPHHANLAMDKITFRDVNCILKDYGDFNSTHLWMKAPFDKCMTNHSTTADTITYMNSIIAETRTSQGSVLISREFQAEFPFKCSYPRSAIMSVASFSPREKVIYTRTAEFGNFTFTMDMYMSDAYETPYNSFPVKKDLNEKMYLEVKVASNDSKLVLFPDKCWATPDQDPENSKSFAFIEEGCSKDETLVFNYEENAVQQFSIDAFRFMGESAGALVYLHCSVEACRKGDSDSRCAKGCEDNGSRKRRSSEMDSGLVLDSVARQTVSIGPVQKESVAPIDQERKSASSLTVIAAVAGVLGVVVLALIVALVTLYKRFHNPQNAARVVYSKTSNEEHNQLVV